MAAEFYRSDRGAGTADGEHGANGFDLHALSGNLCRCTGYRPIRDAAFGLGMPRPDDPLRERLTEPAPTAVATAAGAGSLRRRRSGSPSPGIPSANAASRIGR